MSIQLHVRLGFSLHRMKLCVLFMANSEVLLNCHVLFKQTYIQTPPIITFWVSHTHQGRAHSKLWTMLSS